MTTTTTRPRPNVAEDAPGVPTTAPPRDEARTGLGATGLGLTALTTVVALECIRAIFSVTYKVGESIGFLVAGLVVVLLFALPFVVPLLRRIVPPRALLLAFVGLLGAGRLAVQVVDQPTFVMLAALVGIALVTLTLVLAALRAHLPEGSVVAAVGVTAGLGLDTALRATGITWDTIWRDDVVSWALTGLVIAGLVAAAILAARAGVVPDGEDRRAGLTAFLVWPYLYLAVFYVQSTAYIDSSAAVPVTVGLGVALGGAALAVVVVVAAARAGLPRPAVAALAGVLAGLAWLLTTVTGPAVLALCIAAQAAAAALYGTAAGAERDEHHHAGLGRTASAFAGGALLFAVATLAYTIHPLQPLPVTNRAVPVVVALGMLAALRARPARTAAAIPRLAWGVAGALAALALAVPLIVAVTWPAADAVTATGRPLRVMTFNIDQGVAEGPLDLEEVARNIERGQPDIVSIQELGRGWAVSGMTDEAEWLRHRLAMPYGWAPANDNQFGNIILSRLPILDREAVTLQKLQGKQTRSVEFLTVEGGDGRPILVIGGHLENGDEQQYHDARAQAYRDIVARWGAAPRTVFLGDFNTYPREVSVGWPELNIPLDAGFHTTQDTVHCTMPTSNDNCPDWIMASPDGALAPVTIVVDRPDHRPIVAEVTFPS